MAFTKFDKVIPINEFVKQKKLAVKAESKPTTRPCICGGVLEPTNLELPNRGMKVWFCERCGEMRMLPND